LSPFLPTTNLLDQTDMDSSLNMLGVGIDLGGLILILLGFYWFVRGMSLFNAIEKKDSYFIKEYGSKTRPPFFFVALGVTLCVCGFIVVFVPFATEV